MTASFPQHLLDGYRAFTSQRLPTEQTRYRELSERGQSPAVMVIGCCDSRVSPEVIFDAGPGELFVVRNVANLVPVFQPDGGAHGVSAALEYAARCCASNTSWCSATRNAAASAPLSTISIRCRRATSSAAGWRCSSSRAKSSSSATARPMQDFTTRIEKAAVFRSLENLMTFPFVRTRVERGEMELHGAYFGVAEGSLFVLDQAAKEFRSVREAQAASSLVGCAKAQRAHHRSTRSDGGHACALPTLRILLTPPSSSR